MKTIKGFQISKSQTNSISLSLEHTHTHTLTHTRTNLKLFKQPPNTNRHKQTLSLLIQVLHFYFDLKVCQKKVAYLPSFSFQTKFFFQLVSCSTLKYKIPQWVRRRNNVQKEFFILFWLLFNITCYFLTLHETFKLQGRRHYNSIFYFTFLFLKIV